MKDDPSPKMLPKLIEQANRSMGKISSLIEDLLNVSRMNEGQLHLGKSKFTISHLLNQCCNHVRVAGKHDLIFEGDTESAGFCR
jgi:signal transduction histidine kinase